MRTLQELLNEEISVRDMTVNELKTFIRYQTGQVNLRLSDYDYNNELLNDELEKLKQFGGIGKAGTKREGQLLLNFRGKQKVDLVRQASELRYFNKWDIYSNVGKNQLTEKEQKAYDSFVENYSKKGVTWSKEEWRSMVEAFGSLGSELSSYGYGDANRKAGASSSRPLIMAIGRAKDNSKLDIFTAMRMSVKNRPSLTQRERIKDIVELMNKNPRG